MSFNLQQRGSSWESYWASRNINSALWLGNSLFEKLAEAYSHKRFLSSCSKNGARRKNWSLLTTYSGKSSLNEPYQEDADFSNKTISSDSAILMLNGNGFFEKSFRMGRIFLIKCRLLKIITSCVNFGPLFILERRLISSTFSTPHHFADTFPIIRVIHSRKIDIIFCNKNLVRKK